MFWHVPEDTYRHGGETSESSAFACNLQIALVAAVAVHVEPRVKLAPGDNLHFYLLVCLL